MAGTALPIAEGGTSQKTAPGARVALGLEIGVDIQAHDSDLDSLSTLNGVADLMALEGIATTGLAVRTAANTWTTRTLVAPAAGITITNPAGIAGDITFALANDLAGLEGMSGTGFAVHTAANTWTERTITGTANEIGVSNGNGVSANPQISLPSSITLSGKTIIGGSFTGGLFDSATGLATGSSLLTIKGNIDSIQAQGTTAAGGSLAIAMFNATPATGPRLDFYRSEGTGIGSATVVVSGDSLGEINFIGAQQTGTFSNQNIAAVIRAEVDGTVTSGAGADMPGRLIFLTTPDGSGTPAEAMRIASTKTVSMQSLLDLSASGAGQVVFPAAQNASAGANTLDDYEEGTFTPTITSGTGTITTISSNTGWYTKVGNLVSGGIFFTITTNGTGATNLNATLPFTNGAAGASCFGEEVTSTGKGLTGYIANGSSSLSQIFFADGTYPGASGRSYSIGFLFRI